MKRILFIVFALITSFAQAQVPQGINYQAVARDGSGNLYVNQPISVRFTIGNGVNIDPADNTTYNYQEVHTGTPQTTTTALGLFNLKIGTGVPTGTSTFGANDWQSNQQHLLVEVDFNGGTSYTILGSAVPFQSVPYAFLAQDVVNKDDADADPTNEIQTLSMSGDILTLTNGTLPPTNIDLTPYKELPATATNGQVLTWDATNTQWVAQMPTAFSESITSLGFNSSDTTITYIDENGASTTIDLKIDDADADPTNELITSFVFTQTNNNLTISEGTNSRTVDLSSLSSSDHDWYKVTTTSPPSSINEDIYTQGKVGIGTPITLTPPEKLTLQDGNIHIQRYDSQDLKLSFDADNNGIDWALGVEDSNDGDFKIASTNNLGSSTRMTILSNGNVGIGTTSPTSLLEVNGTTTTNQLVVTNGINANTAGYVLMNSTTNVGNAVWTDPTTLFPSGTPWSLGGNNVTASDFLGTTNNLPLSIKVGNSEKLRLETNGVLSVLNTSNSVFIGKDVAVAHTTQGNNTAVGCFALQDLLSGNNNSAFGLEALRDNTNGSSNVAMGKQALLRNTLGSQSVAVGYKAMQNVDATNFGSGLYLGTHNVALGAYALYGGSGANGTTNTAVGSSSLRNNISGEKNVALGFEAGLQNTAGDLNTFIGYGANAGSSMTSLTNATAIGANATVSQDNSLVLGDNADVGIGTSTPTSKLDINGQIRIRGGSPGAGKILTSDANGNAAWASNSSYTKFGNLNSATSLVYSTSWTGIGSPNSFTKTYDDSKIEVTFNSNIFSGTFTPSTGVIMFELRIDGTTIATFDNKGVIKLTNTEMFISMFAIFEGLSSGTHSLQVYAKMSTGSSSGVLIDTGGWGGSIIVKETF